MRHVLCVCFRGEVSVWSNYPTLNNLAGESYITSAKHATIPCARWSKHISSFEGNCVYAIKMRRGTLRSAINVYHTCLVKPLPITHSEGGRTCTRHTCRVQQQLVDKPFIHPLCIQQVSSVVLILSTVPRDTQVSRYIYAEMLNPRS